MTQCQKPYTKQNSYIGSATSIYSKEPSYITPSDEIYSQGDLVFACFSVVMALLISDTALLLLDDNLSYIQL